MPGDPPEEAWSHGFVGGVMWQAPSRIIKTAESADVVALITM
jgi:hypothetical protein